MLKLMIIVANLILSSEFVIRASIRYLDADRASKITRLLRWISLPLSLTVLVFGLIVQSDAQVGEPGSKFAGASLLAVIAALLVSVTCTILSVGMYMLMAINHARVASGRRIAFMLTVQSAGIAAIGLSAYVGASLTLPIMLAMFVVGVGIYTAGLLLERKM